MVFFFGFAAGVFFLAPPAFTGFFLTGCFAGFVLAALGFLLATLGFFFAPLAPFAPSPAGFFCGERSFNSRFGLPAFFGIFPSCVSHTEDVHRTHPDHARQPNQKDRSKKLCWGRSRECQRTSMMGDGAFFLSTAAGKSGAGSSTGALPPSSFSAIPPAPPLPLLASPLLSGGENLGLSSPVTPDGWLRGGGVHWIKHLQIQNERGMEAVGWLALPLVISHLTAWPRFACAQHGRRLDGRVGHSCADDGHVDITI